MALMITKNDINRVYGTPYTPAPKITKSDLDTVYGTPPSYTDIQQNSLPNLIKKQTSGLSTPTIQTAKEAEELYKPHISKLVISDGFEYNKNSEEGNSAEYHSLSADEDYEYKSYKNSLKKGELSPLADFNLYKSTSKQIDEKIVGVTTSNGIKITGKTKHSIARMLGSLEERRNGVSVDDVPSALISKESKISPIKISDGSRSQKFKNNAVEVTINPDTGVIVQMNPAHSRKKVK